MQAELTPKQTRLLAYLEAQLVRRGKIPSLRQAAGDLGVTHAAVAQNLKILEEKGYVQREGRYSRNLYLLSRNGQPTGSQRWREVPVIGRVTAGLPMYAQTEWDGTLVLDTLLFRGHNLFALRVKGDSMKNAGILDGDLAICEPRQYAHNGEIVVALVNAEEATVKRFFLQAKHIELRPENSAYQTMHYQFGEVLIQGKVIGIHRGPEGIR